MKASALISAVTITLALTEPAEAAGIDMNDPHRALGREADIRIDAQLARQTVTPGSAIGVTWQIENFSDQPVAVADRVTDASYDDDTRTITVAIGYEIPPEGNLPRMLLIQPGEKRVLRAAATPRLTAAAARGRGRSPRFVRIKVAVLRDVAPFARLIDEQSEPGPLPEALFETWLESNETIFLNELPVQFNPAERSMGEAADRGAERASF